MNTHSQKTTPCTWVDPQGRRIVERESARRIAEEYREIARELVEATIIIQKHKKRIEDRHSKQIPAVVHITIDIFKE